MPPVSLFGFGATTRDEPSPWWDSGVEGVVVSVLESKPAQLDRPPHSRASANGQFPHHFNIHRSVRFPCRERRFLASRSSTR
jgi:hypothetical protein